LSSVRKSVLSAFALASLAVGVAVFAWVLPSGGSLEMIAAGKQLYTSIAPHAMDEILKVSRIGDVSSHPDVYLRRLMMHPATPGTMATEPSRESSRRRQRGRGWGI
jgi:hypothetical protein